jgi:hypothetical protein
MGSYHSANVMSCIRNFLSAKFKKGSFVHEDSSTYVKTAADL